MKKTLSILAFLMMALAIPQSVKAWDFSYTYQGQTLYYNISGNSVIVTYPGTDWNVPYDGYIIPTGHLEIPSSVTYDGITYSVTSIGLCAFRYSGITSVTIPNSVTSIGDGAFVGCSGLTSVTIPNSVTSIGNSAFGGCSSLTSVTIPNSVTLIGNSAFAYCSGLTSVQFNATSCEDFSRTNRPFDSCPNIIDVTFGDSVLVIPANFCYNVTSLTSVTISNSVTSIGVGAFQNCSGLTSVTIPNSVTSIGGLAFSGCSSLTSVTIPNSVTSIGNYAFANCSGFTSVTIGNSVTSIGVGAFQYCSGLTSVTIGNSVTSIDDYVFANCSGLTSVTIPNSVTSIGSSAFSDCIGLTSVTIGNSVTSIGDYVFANCSGLTSVTIPNSVTSIGSSAFSDCIGLTAVTIGNSVTWIGYSAFQYCSSLDSIFMLPDTPPTIYSGTFSTIPTNIPIKVPCGATSAYNEASYWNVFTRVFEDDSCNNRLTLNTNNSGLGRVYGGGMYAPGSQVEFYAVPRAGAQFIRWNDNNNNNPRSITITSDTTLTAYFDTVALSTVFYDITVTTSNASQGSCMGSGSYADGTVAIIAAVPNDGFAFSMWHDGNTTNPRSITVTENTFYIASFSTATTNVVHDTTYITLTDTVTNINYDTMWLYDTVYVHDTIYIHDTVYVPQEGIGVFETVNAKIYQRDGRIVVESGEGISLGDVWVFDAVGRRIGYVAGGTTAYRTVAGGIPVYQFDIPATGTYLVKVGSAPARRVVVVR